MLQIDIITLFPEYFTPLDVSIIGRAKQRGLVDINILNLRDFSKDTKHRRVDEKPFGGGAGMLLMAPPIFSAVESVRREDSLVILTSAQGEKFEQKVAKQIACKNKHLIFICGHYQGVDGRVLKIVDKQISLGDFILTNGNLATLAISDAIIRLLPNVLGDEKSASYESFSSGLLEYPQYTKPVQFRNMSVPDVLLSGNHRQIQLWREQKALEKTTEKRPDLIEKRSKNNEKSI